MRSSWIHISKTSCKTFCQEFPVKERLHWLHAFTLPRYPPDPHNTAYNTPIIHECFITISTFLWGKKCELSFAADNGSHAKSVTEVEFPARQMYTTFGEDILCSIESLKGIIITQQLWRYYCKLCLNVFLTLISDNMILTNQQFGQFFEKMLSTFVSSRRLPPTFRIHHTAHHRLFATQPHEEELEEKKFHKVVYVIKITPPMQDMFVLIWMDFSQWFQILVTKFKNVDIF